MNLYWSVYQGHARVIRANTVERAAELITNQLPFTYPGTLKKVEKTISLLTADDLPDIIVDIEVKQSVLGSWD